MDVTLTATITHLCPYVDEIDVGTVTITYTPDEGEVIELHALAKYLQSFHDKHLTHEALTQQIADHYPGIHVSSTWETAGIRLECRAVPRNSIRPEGA